MRLVAFKRRGDVGADNQYTSDRLVDVIKKQVTFVNETLKSTLKVRKVESIVTSSTTNSADVLADEFDPPFAPDVPFKWSAVSIEVDIMVVGTRDCMDACPTDNDILHGFDFCNQAIVDRLTPTQKTCLEDKICGAGEAATLDINGAPFTTIPSGDTYDLDVVNSDDDAVGVSSSGDWVIADSTVRNNATPTWSDTIKAEATLTLGESKMLDSDGITTVTADYIPTADGFMFTATSCPPCADANIEVNGVAVGTVASGGTFDQLVQDDAGASVGTSANPSIVADCVVNNDAGSPTFTQNIQPEQTFSLAQSKMLDSDGATTVLADYKPNTDGFMFTASACTPCVSRAWVRNPDWLAMPSLVDGDNIIYILSAVKDGVNNFFSFTSTLTSGTYEVDLYNDGTTVTTHSAGQADFNLLYSKGTAEITTHGDDYKQVITKITGNFLLPKCNARHPSVSNQNLSGILSIKMASQTTNSLYNSFSNYNSTAILNRFEEFEFVGTCNVTSLRWSFSRCRVLGKITGNFPSVGSMQGTFQYGGDVDLNDMQVGGTYFRQTFSANYSIREITNQNYFINISDFGSTLQGAQSLLYFGTPSAPMDFGGYSSGAGSAFQNNTVLRHAYFQNLAPSNLQNTFNGCGSIQIISGMDCSNVTNTSNAFKSCHSLETLEISNMGMSFSLEDCNFNQAGLVNVFDDLPSATATITVTDNPGVVDLTAADLLIATNKGWTVTT